MFGEGQAQHAPTRAAEGGQGQSNNAMVIDLSDDTIASPAGVFYVSESGTPPISGRLQSERPDGEPSPKKQAAGNGAGAPGGGCVRASGGGGGNEGGSPQINFGSLLEVG